MNDDELWKQFTSEITKIKKRRIHFVRSPKQIIIRNDEKDKPAKLDIEENFSKYNSKIKKKINEIDATIDLHGLTQEQAFNSLQNFIEHCFKSGKRVLLVITGKGTIEKKSVLKENLPNWLLTPYINQRLGSYCQANAQHGGEGAFYLILKKNL